MSAQSQPIVTRQHYGEMILVPIKDTIEHFAEIYDSELRGRVADRYYGTYNGEGTAPETHVAKKIYIYNFLIYLQNYNPEAKMGIIGRSYYIPIPKCSRFAARMHTGLLEIPGLGAFIVSLGSLEQMEIETTDERSEVYRSDGDVIPVHPLHTIKKITYKISILDKFEVHRNVFPSEFKDIRYKVSKKWRGHLDVISQTVQKMAQEHLRLCEDVPHIFSSQICMELKKIRLVDSKYFLKSIL